MLASWRSMTKIAGSGSGSISQRHGSADPDPNPDPHRVAIANFWRTFHHDREKISPWLVRRGGGDCTPSPLQPITVPSRTKLQCTLQLRGQIHCLYFISSLYVLCVWDITNVVDPDHIPVPTFKKSLHSFIKFILNDEIELKYFDKKRYFLVYLETCAGFCIFIMPLKNC